MVQPVVLMLSRDHELTCEFAGCLQGVADIRACDQPDELLELSGQWKPSAIVLDYRRLGLLGPGEQRLVGTLESRFPDSTLAVLAEPRMASSMEGVSASGRVRTLVEAPTRERVMQLCRDILEFPEDEANEIAAPEEEVAPVAPVVPVFENTAPTGTLAGITRRFETSCPKLTQMLRDLEVAARHDVTILLIGETGAGKTFLSRLIHEVSPRRHEPFLPVACGALPNDLIESELFGHAKGAFTSAHADKEGKFLAARRGSLLLDEIDVLGLEQQVKLLRVIETGEFEPVGSNQTMHCEARLIVASNLQLQPLVEQNRFRPDLYYRLNMLKFEIPPLRQRRMDIMPLAKRFVRQFAIKHGVTISEIDSSLFQALVGYPWPGNVRELEHVIQRAVIYCRDGILTAAHLPSHIVQGKAGPTNDPSVDLGMGARPAAPVAAVEHSLGGQIALTEREIIEQTLFRNSFSRTRTAKELGISRVTLYNKMKRYGIGGLGPSENA